MEKRRLLLKQTEDSVICGANMAVSPEGKVLANMGGKFGMLAVEFDPRQKCLKPAGFGNPYVPHYEYIEAGRKPWQYRNAGPSVVLSDEQMPYLRVCAHRGFNTIAPENSMPAFGAAVAMGAEEIEFDIWTTKDGVLVSCHDSTLHFHHRTERSIHYETSNHTSRRPGLFR